MKFLQPPTIPNRRNHPMSLDKNTLAASSLSVKRKRMRKNEKKAIVKVFCCFPIEQAFLNPNINKAQESPEASPASVPRKLTEIDSVLQAPVSRIIPISTPEMHPHLNQVERSIRNKKEISRTNKGAVYIKVAATAMLEVWILTK